jgi:hypothetical protein
LSIALYCVRTVTLTDPYPGPHTIVRNIGRSLKTDGAKMVLAEGTDDMFALKKAMQLKCRIVSGTLLL